MVSEITNLKSTCAVGSDEIPAKILKLCTFECAPFLVNCFNNTKKLSNFQLELKSANVVPVPKTGDSLCKSNYRPISILPAVSKVFERIMQKQINTYFKDKLSPLLGGYKKGYSCQHSLLRLLENWRICLDNKGIVGTILIDISKAFDVIDHKLLIAKLAAYGFSEGSLRLILSSSRKQRVKLNQFFSEWYKILSGVPQGSILGPILFNIFVNDLILFLENTSVCNYADDNYSISLWFNFWVCKNVRYGHKQFYKLVFCKFNENEPRKMSYNVLKQTRYVS